MQEGNEEDKVVYPFHSGTDAVVFQNQDTSIGNVALDATWGG